MGGASEILAVGSFEPAVFGLMVFGVIWQGFATLMLVRGARAAAATATAIEALALEGQPQKARIRARESRRELSPLLATLSGEAHPRFEHSLRSAVLASLAVTAPACLAVLATFLVRSPKTHLALSQAIAVLIPLGLLGFRLVLFARRRSQREIRRACISLLEDNARAEVERERSAALRRRFDEATEP